jgi:methionine synthase II (cobalamin-independent)
VSIAWAGATGIGSLPGNDVREAARQVFGELPWPHLPELPGRGPGSDLVGRAGGLLVDLPLETTAAGWRMAARPGRDLRRARGFLSEDLDALEEVGSGFAGPLKVQVAGPWTLAAGVETRSGHRALVDEGARRGLAESLAEGLRGHLADVATRVPGATLTLQVDEPSLPAVLAGAIPTASGFGTIRAVDPVEATALLATVIDAAGLAAAVCVHCCAADAPLRLLHDLPVDAVSVDAALTGTDRMAEWLDRGRVLLAGVVATDAVPPPSAGEVAAQVRSMVARTGFVVPEVLPRLVLTPACGMAGCTADAARTVMTTIRQAADLLRADPEGEGGRP